MSQGDIDMVEQADGDVCRCSLIGVGRLPNAAGDFVGVCLRCARLLSPGLREELSRIRMLPDEEQERTSWEMFDEQALDESCRAWDAHRAGRFHAGDGGSLKT